MSGPGVPVRYPSLPVWVARGGGPSACSGNKLFPLKSLLGCLLWLLKSVTPKSMASGQGPNPPPTKAGSTCGALRSVSRQLLFFAQQLAPLCSRGSNCPPGRCSAASLRDFHWRQSQIVLLTITNTIYILPYQLPAKPSDFMRRTYRQF